MNIKEGERMLKQMDVLITTNADTNKSLQLKVFQVYKKKYDELRSKYFKLKEDYTYTKKMEEMVLSTKDIELTNLTTDGLIMSDQQMLIKNDETLNKSSQKLEIAKRSLMEIDKDGQNIILDIHKNNMQMKSTLDKVENLNSTIQSSNGILNRIIHREHRNKLLIGMFSLTLVTFFLLILYSHA
jgi:hypothetical protein